MTTTRYLIKHATVMPFTLQPSGAVDLDPRVQDVLIVGDQIVEVADHIEAGAEPTQVIDARNHLLVPGFVNAHVHSVEIFGERPLRSLTVRSLDAVFLSAPQAEAPQPAHVLSAYYAGSARNDQVWSDHCPR